MANTFKLGNGNWATKKEATLAYNDENSNFKPLPFTFDRASTATVVNKDGLIETVGIDEPRIDFLNNTKGHLLLEPQRTNSLLQSNQFDTTWTTTNATVTSGQTGVGGSTDAWLLNSSAGYLRQTVSLSGASTMSVYAKKGTAQGIRIRIDASVDANCYIDLSDGSEFFPNTGTNLDVTNVGNNWYRISLSIDSTIGNVRFYALDNTGSNTSGTIYIQYAQLEAGSYATSYIPTQGSAVTRSVDYTNIENSPILQGTNQFTLFFEAKDFLLVNGTNTSFDNIMFVLGAGQSAYDSGTGIHIYNKTWFYWNGSSAEFIGFCYNGLTDSKFAISYDGIKFTRYADGIKLGEYTTSASMVNWDTITTGAMSDAQNEERNFNLSDLRLYNTALTDAELIALTS